MAGNLPETNEFVGETVIGGWELEEEVGRGNTGVVYRATQNVLEDFENEAACKLMPLNDLRDGWEVEIQKCLSLYEHPNVVNFKEYDRWDYNSETYVCYVTEYVHGSDLREYIDENLGEITPTFIESVIGEILSVMHAMEQLGISHNDLHAGNVLLSESELLMENHPTVKVTDFGVGGSVNSLDPKDDYAQLGDICLDLLQAIDKEELDSRDRYYYEFLLNDFVAKRVLETDPTQGEFVRSPRALRDSLEEGWTVARDRLENERNVELEDPFDYLSCEQMGNSFKLIDKLYTEKFPGYDRVQSKMNTLLTGPRGCGKTTILKNMSMETKIKSGSISTIDEIEYLGIYYPCRDLYFAFHYLDDDPSPRDRELLIHYFSLSLLKEFIETLGHITEEFGVSIPDNGLRDFEDELSQWITKYPAPPEDSNLLNHFASVLNKEKNRVGAALRRRPRDLDGPEVTLPIDFLPPNCSSLINRTTWGNDLPIFFLIDDYSLPTISRGMQSTLNDLLMERWDQVFFKVSTESITSFHPYDSSGKLIEESREFETVDLAAHFIGHREKREDFLSEVINTRLENTEGLHDKYKNLSEILGENPYDSYNDLARRIRGDEQVTYAGFGTIRDLFSGDISEILRLIRGMFEDEGQDEKWKEGTVSLPIPENVQDRVIRQHGNRFLNKIEGVPDTGTQLRQIAEVFGEEAHEVLLTQNSSNQTSDPPRQAFRIEIRDSFSFEKSEHFAEVAQKIRKNSEKRYNQDELVENAETIYNDMLRYGVFLLDVRGKSIRGKVVPRLYLRRLLLPTFNLTPSQRDFIGMEASDFLHLIVDPEGYASEDDGRPKDRSLLDYE